MRGEPYEQTEAYERRPLVPGAEDDDERYGPAPGEPAAASASPIRATPFVLRDPREIAPRRWLYVRSSLHPTLHGSDHRAWRAREDKPDPGRGGGDGDREAAAGIRVPEPLRVWVWNGEDPREEIERRLTAICLHYEITADDIGDRLFIDSGREMPIVIAQKVGDGATVYRPVVEAVKAEVLSKSIDVVILDPFVSCHAVPENDNGAIDRVVKEWGGIAEAGNCCVEFVHHVRKAGAGQASYTVEDARGGSALIGAVRSARVLNAMSTDEASQAGVAAEKRRRFFRVDDGKANMHPPAEGASWHEMVSVPLGNHTSETPEDIVGVVTAWTLPGLSDSLQSGDVRRVQDAIAAGSWADNVRADNWAGRAIASTLGLSVDDPDERKRITKLLELWKKNGCLKTEIQRNTRTGRDQTMLVVGAVA